MNQNDVSNDIILQNKKKEERKRLILKLIANEKFDIIRKIESLRIPHTQLGLTLNDPVHRQWLEEFTVIFDDNGDDEIIQVSLDQVDIFVDEHGEAIVKFDFDDILENEEFNIGYTVNFDEIIDENGSFDKDLFEEKLKLKIQDAIDLMIKQK